MALTVVDSDLQVKGTISSTGLTPPNGSITNAAVSSTAGIAASKLEHQFPISRQLVAEGTAITAIASETLHIVRGATGEIVAVEAAIFTQATGADRTVTVDLEKSTGAGAFATVLSSTVDITNSTAVRTPVAGTISSADLTDGDMLRAVVTVAGSAGNQAEGLLLTVTLREDAS